MRKSTYSKIVSLILTTSLIFGNSIKVQASTTESNIDFNNDGIVDIQDLAKLATNYNFKSGGSKWDSKYDINCDNIIDIYDLVKISKKMGTTINPVVNVTSIGLSKATDTLIVGNTDTLTATIAPSNATNSSVTWTSSNTNIATVNKGVITAVNAGTATITANSDDGNKTAICTVTVNNQGITFGNTEGNIVNGGLAVEQDDWIYYCQYDTSANYPGAPNNSSIYKMNSNGSNKTKLIDVVACDLNIKGDWLYYINNSNDKIYKIKTDGSNNQELSDRTVLYDMIIVGDLIYVMDMTSIIILNLDGSYYDSLWGSARDFVVSENTVYFNNKGNSDSIWTTGSSNNKLNDEPSYNINVYGNNIYYINSQDKICRIGTNGSSSTEIGSDKATSLLINEGWIYYSNKSDNNKLYKMKLDGTCRVIVSNIGILTFNIVGDWVTYTGDGSTNFIKK